MSWKTDGRPMTTAQVRAFNKRAIASQERHARRLARAKANLAKVRERCERDLYAIEQSLLGAIAGPRLVAFSVAMTTARLYLQSERIAKEKP